MNQSSPTDPNSDIFRAALLMVLTILSVGMSYTISILVANWIGPDNFENYAVSIAMIGMLASLAEAGTGKFALKFIPASVLAGRWDLLSGFWRFSFRLVLLVSFVLTTVVVVLEIVDDNKLGSYPIGLGVILLVAVAFAGVGVDFVMASRMPIRGAVIARLVIPGTTLVTLFFVQNSWGLDAVRAVICFCFGSFVGALLSLTIFLKKSPPQIFKTPPLYERSLWLRECAYFSATAFLMSWIFKASVVVFELLPIPEREVAYFAAALETGGLVLLLSKSTDKLFQPELSMILEEQNWDYGLKLRKKRFALIGTGCALFLTTIFVFGKNILALYGSEFVAGYPALCFIALGHCAWTMFSLSPSYLRYVGRDSLLFSVILIGAITMAVFTAIFGSAYGATGGGIGFCLVVSSISLTFFIFANRDLKRARS